MDNSFDEMSFAVGKLYKELFDGCYVTGMDDFTVELMYKEYQGVSRSEVVRITDVIKENLEPEEATLILAKFGLKNEPTFTEVVRDNSWTQEDVDVILDRALNKLRECNRMPFVYQFNDTALEERVKCLFDELVDIHRDPIFALETKIKRELVRIETSGRVNVSLLMPVEELGFDYELCNKLKLGGFRTFGDLKYATTNQIYRIPNMTEDEIDDVLETILVLRRRFL